MSTTNTPAVTATISPKAIAGAAILSRFRFIDFQRATTKFFAIELCNGGFRLFLSRHFDKAKAT